MVSPAFPVVEIGIVVLTSLIFGVLLQRIGQSSALGYIAAGLLLGPLGAGLLGGEQGITTLFGEIGVMLLLFYLGLELNLKRFKETGAVATVLAFVEMLVAFMAGFLVAKAFGFSTLESLVIGAMLTATSTVITGKFLIERGIIDGVEGRLTVSVLILEDFFAVLVLALVSALTKQPGFNLLVINALLFVIALFFVVSKVSKHVLNFMSNLGREDMMWLYGLGVFLVVSYFGNTYIGIPVALGAYFAGFALAETPYGDRIKKELSLFREFFVLFFFVSLGAQATLPQDPLLYGLLAALAAGYVFAKLFAHAFMGTAIGLELKRAVVGGILLSPAGEFAIIIALAAQSFLPHGKDILTLAILLTICTTSVLPLLYERRNAIVAWFARLFPSKLQLQSRIVQQEMKAIEKLALDASFQNAYVRSLGRLFTNLVVAVAIVYLSYLTQAEISLPFLGFLPPGASLGLLVLPLIIWPVYKFIAELKFLANSVTQGLVRHAFSPKEENAQELGLHVADLVAGIALTLTGVAAIALLYSWAPDNFLVLLIPGAYTLLALMYVSKSFYGLIEQYELMESLLAEELPKKARKLAELSREFSEHAQYFQKLHSARLAAKEKIVDALQAEQLSEAKTHLVQFKRKETQALVNLFDFSRLYEVPRLRGLVKQSLQKNEEFHKGIHDVRTKAAFEQYLRTHLKPHVFETPDARNVEEAARKLIERDLRRAKGAGTRQEKMEAPPSSLQTPLQKPIPGKRKGKPPKKQKTRS